MITAGHAHSGFIILDAFSTHQNLANIHHNKYQVAVVVVTCRVDVVSQPQGLVRELPMKDLAEPYLQRLSVDHRSGRIIY